MSYGQPPPDRPGLMTPATARTLGGGLATAGGVGILLGWGTWWVVPSALGCFLGLALTWRAGLG